MTNNTPPRGQRSLSVRMGLEKKTPGLLCVVCHLYFSRCGDGGIGVSCGWVIRVQLSICGAHDLTTTQKITKHFRHSVIKILVQCVIS